MKIALIVNPLIPVPPEQYGGIERIVYMLIQELVKNGHDITLYAHPKSEPGCYLIPFKEDIKYTFKNFIQINLLTARIALRGFDLVHTFGRMNNIAFLMLTKVPKVVSYQLPPTVSQIKKAVKIARNKTLIFTACSDFIAKQIKIYANVSTIYNGIDLNLYDFQGNVGVDAPLVFLGRIQEEKGTEIAVKVAIQTGRKLIIAGNVPDEPIHLCYFNERIKPFIDNNQITYIGPVNNKQKNILLGKAGALLMPVTWDEPFGIVMAEALACGTPVIGFKRGAVPEVIENNVNGFVCETVAEMITLVTRLEEIARAECRRSAEAHFSAEILSKQYVNLYQQLIGRG